MLLISVRLEILFRIIDGKFGLELLFNFVNIVYNYFFLNTYLN